LRTFGVNIEHASTMFTAFFLVMQRQGILHFRQIDQSGVVMSEQDAAVKNYTRISSVHRGIGSVVLSGSNCRKRTSLARRDEL
jgi:hypothetical protein